MVDHDDWRVTVAFPDSMQAQQAAMVFLRREVADDARRQLGGSIAVGAGSSQLFLYAGTEAAAREAERIARDTLTRHHLTAEFAIHRWHPLEERWEDPDAAMPRTETERRAEHQRLLDDETTESLAVGVAQWEVRAELPSHHEAVALADKLRQEGRSVVRRWKFLVVGAGNEDEARQLAGKIRQEAPPEATVRAEHSPVCLPFEGF